MCLRNDGVTSRLINLEFTSSYLRHRLLVGCGKTGFLSACLSIGMALSDAQKAALTALLAKRRYSSSL